MLEYIGASIKREAYGNKAASLSQLSSTFTVPNGFVLSNDFFFEYLKAISFPYAHSHWYAKNREAQACILKSRFPPQLSKHVVKGLQILGLTNLPCAIRSSATLEDGVELSLAGIFESVVDVRGVDRILEGIQSCYASLFSDKALHFCSEHHIELDRLAMGVIVQEYVKGEHSGVAFTADTHTHDDQRIVISSVKGPCGDFVNGFAPSRHTVFNKHALSILEDKPGNEDRFMSDEKLTQVAALARDAERSMGYPCDIEWTVRGEQIFLLQVRPITALKDLRAEFRIDSEMDKQWFLGFLPDDTPVKPILKDYIDSSFPATSYGMYRTGYRSCGLETTLCNGYRATRITA